MSVTDLTGTTWVLNDTINMSIMSYDCNFTAKSGNYVVSGSALGSKNTDYWFLFNGSYGTYPAIYFNREKNHWRYTVNNHGSEVVTSPTVTFTGGTDSTNPTLISFLEANGTLQTPTVSRKSVDLTTLPGWSSLPSGSHSITIVAKADGYRDSEPSAAVSVEKAAEEYTDCITFTGESSDFTLAVGSGGAKEWDGTVEYSTDHNTWTTWDGTAVSSVNKKLYLRGSGNTKFLTSKSACLSLSARAACSGNIQTLLEYSNPPTSIPSSKCYGSMFRGCTSLTQAPELPATTLASYCYFNMFNGCTSLTQAPELPATTLASSCYQGMFYSCTNLTTAPALPATTLADYCYSSMFRDCTNLTTAPALPATTLADYCYQYMFRDCTSLKISTAQSSEYSTAWRIPSSGTISSTTSFWNESMLAGTGGTFTSNPSINTTYYGAWKTATNLISFTIAGTSYQAEEGMTWAEWVESSYNTGNFALNGSYVWNRNGLYVSTQNSTASKYYVGINASIANGGTFYLASTESGGSGK